jgi:cation:H+ antiporter
VTTLVASARGLTNVIGGQLIAASALNILFVLGLTMFLFPLSIPREVAQMDSYVAAASAGIIVAMMLPGWRITRGQGAVLVICYFGYLALLTWRQGMLTF